MSAILIKGGPLAERILSELTRLIAERVLVVGRPPRLVLLTFDYLPATMLYLGMQQEAAVRAGIQFEHRSFCNTVPADVIDGVIAGMNAPGNPVDGIVFQQPITGAATQHRDRWIGRVDPTKDTEGMHPENVKRRQCGDKSVFVPCTALACLALLDSIEFECGRKAITVLGNSPVVGEPIADMLRAGLTSGSLDVCDVTTDPNQQIALCRQADLLISATPHAHLVQPNWVKPGAVVIDVGIHEIRDVKRRSGFRVVGDVHPDVANVAGHLTPVPGGVGPVTIAKVMQSVYRSWVARTAQAFEARERRSAHA